MRLQKVYKRQWSWKKKTKTMNLKKLEKDMK